MLPLLLSLLPLLLSHRLAELRWPEGKMNEKFISTMDQIAKFAKFRTNSG
jgi:hypothetical protein